MPAGPEHLERKLAAILYADVAGYSRLTGEDEEGTHRLLSSYLDAITALIDRHNGKVLHFAGDAVLAEFASVVNALTCAVNIQREIKDRNRDLHDNRKVQFRIGINLGDVIVDRNEIYGDGVNVAARLESLAEPGGICISEAVRTAVGNKLPLNYEFLGEQSVKNIAEPVRAYRVQLKPDAVLPTPTTPSKTKRARRRLVMVSAAVVALLGGVTVIAWLAPWQPTTEPASGERAALPLPDKPSIAVLPFTNLSDDPKQEYFSDGITNDIITDLSKFRSLFVIASKSVFVYKGKPVKVQDVSRELGVRYVLEGSVQRASEKVRVNAQLIDATTGHHLWAERYDRDLKDLFALQDEIVQTIVTALAVKVDAVERKRAMRKDTDNLEAYDYVLRGWEYLARTTRSTNMEARQMFQRAIELDPRYASAYVGLGWTYRKAMGHGWTEFPGQALQQAHDLAQKALSLEESAAAHHLLGYVYLPRRQYDLASHALERAIELNPNDWDSHSILASVMLYTGRPDEAIQTYETTLRFNPAMEVDRLFELGLAYYLEMRYDDAIRTLEQGVGRNPDHVFLYIALAAAYAQADRPEDAARAAATVRRLHPFFEVASFGTRFRNPADRASIAQGLRKAELK
ncbi:MAG: tetratricopeptide repeat protein [Gammaproteobacteria bacterium]|nr:tetratricopeptide repeat protein [Gammaproteobacteria bacterium]MCZ6731745.1 tetratricopeptide repeat protein [Gammaproteobacteria bacterium]